MREDPPSYSESALPRHELDDNGRLVVAPRRVLACCRNMIVHHSDCAQYLNASRSGDVEAAVSVMTVEHSLRLVPMARRRHVMGPVIVIVVHGHDERGSIGRARCRVIPTPPSAPGRPRRLHPVRWFPRRQPLEVGCRRPTFPKSGDPEFRRPQHEHAAVPADEPGETPDRRSVSASLPPILL